MDDPDDDREANYQPVGGFGSLSIFEKVAFFVLLAVALIVAAAACVAGTIFLEHELFPFPRR